jgi:hypothetical protein
MCVTAAVSFCLVFDGRGLVLVACRCSRPSIDDTYGVGYGVRLSFYYTSEPTSSALIYSLLILLLKPRRDASDSRVLMHARTVV